MLDKIVEEILNKRKEEEEKLPSYEEQAKEILENFDFNYVHHIMSSKCIKRTFDDNAEYVVWKIVLDRGFDVPTNEELIKLAANLLEDVIRRGDTKSFVFAATGPFKATNRYGILELDFVMHSWSID